MFAVLLGSGLSRAAEIPTGWEITLDLVRRVALAQGEEEQADWALWYRTKTGGEPNYSTLLAQLAQSPAERRSILHSYIEPTPEDREEGRKLPTKAHLAIADLVQAGYVRVIVTTNFDRLMENALRERGIEPTIVGSADALAGAEPLTHSACYILKLHGDYKDARILNTDDELSAYPPEYDRLVDRILDEHGLIIAGWSGEWDHALRAAFLRAPNRRYPVYWAARGKIGAGAQELVEHRGARVIPSSDADSFFTGLQQRVETLAQSQRQNPLSTELLVASAKRFLAKPEYRITLNELFANEADRLVTKLDSSEFAPHGPWGEEDFRRRVRSYEAATEPLGKMVGVLGRWGDGNELPLVLDVIRMLYAHAEKLGGGLVVYLGLRSYPAVLIFMAYGLGLTRAERWTALSRLCSAQITGEHGDPKRIVETLFLWDWKGDNKDLWQRLEGFKQRRTPLSDRLCDVLSEWARSFAGLTPDYELLYERFEMMAALAHLNTTPETDLGIAHAKGEPVRMPVGRIGWHTTSRTKLIRELQAQEARKALVKAGLAQNVTFIDGFVANLERISSRLGYW